MPCAKHAQEPNPMAFSRAAAPLTKRWKAPVDEHLSELLGTEQGIVALPVTEASFSRHQRICEEACPICSGPMGIGPTARRTCSRNAARLSRGIAMDIPRTFHLHMISDCDRRDADHHRQGGAGAICASAGDRASASSGAQPARARAGGEGCRGRARHRALHAVQPRAGRGAGEVLQAAEHALRAGAASRSCRCSNPISARRRRRPSAGQHVLDADYFRRIEALNFTMLHDDGHLAGKSQRRRHHPGRHQPHVEDADLDLSRQSRIQDRQCAARARRSAPAAARGADDGLRGRPGGEPRSASRKSARTA